MTEKTLLKNLKKFQETLEKGNKLSKAIKRVLQVTSMSSIRSRCFAYDERKKLVEGQTRAFLDARVLGDDFFKGLKMVHVFAKSKHIHCV